MKTAYFFSGFDAAGFPEGIARRLREDIPVRGMLLFIASSPAGYEKSEYYLNGNKRWFEKAGIVFKEYRLLDDRIDADTARGLIDTASCILLMGGDTLAQFSHIKTAGLLDAIRASNAVVAGISAGAINMGRTAICTKDDYYPETAVYDGIGIADITVEPHFSPDNSEVISELRAHTCHCVFGMCDGSAIILRGGKISYIGEIYKVDFNAVEKISE